MSSTHTCPICGEDYNIKTVHRCSKKKKAKTPTIAALKAALESERKDLCFEYTKDRIGITLGHEAATERLMPLIEQVLEVIELASDKDGYFDAKNHKVYDIIRKARDILSTLADASGEIAANVEIARLQTQYDASVEATKDLHDSMLAENKKLSDENAQLRLQINEIVKKQLRLLNDE